jgi:hypothetical protein
MSGMIQPNQGDEKTLVRIFAWYYADSYRHHQKLRGRQSTYVIPKTDRQTGMVEWRKMVRRLVRRGCNPLQVVDNEMFRYLNMNEPDPPSLEKLIFCSADPAELEIRTLNSATAVVSSDIAAIKRVGDTMSHVFDTPMTMGGLLDAAVDEITSSVIKAAAVYEAYGNQQVDKLLWKSAVATYLKCPSAYRELQLSFVREVLLPLRDYTTLRQGRT